MHQTEWKNGERNGAYIEYYSDGKIKVAGQYYPFEKFDYITSLQNRTGEWKYWNIDGELIKTETWENAKLVSLHEYISSNPFSNSPDTTQIITLNCFGKYCLDTDIKTYGTKCENSYVGYKHDIIYHFYKGDSLDHIMLTPSKEEPEIIQQMLTTSNRFRTEKGIGIGSTIEEIIQSGENVLIRNKEGSNSIYLYFPDLNLVAAVDDDTKMLLAFSGLSL
ncbi:MAG: hypothetical protein IPM77_11825 [Crocinitomicaceae bacterium]|nr:hypothetical protein [Crocinitomicaceae bacterium]